MPEPTFIFEEGRNESNNNIASEYEFELEEEEDLLHKNTPSFRCLVQPEISRSSIFTDKYYYFPEIEDPDLEFALWGPEPVPDYDENGIIKYKELCKKEEIIPFRKVIQHLVLSTLDLRYYGLKDKEMKSICGVLNDNIYIKSLLLEENFLSPKSVGYLAVALETNQTITTLNLKHCRIGNEGAELLGDIFMTNSSIVYLDLSFNLLGDDGFLCIANGIRFNTSITTLNLSHNELGTEALFAFRSIVEDNFTIIDLDLSWNYLYKPKGMKEFMEGLLQNSKLQKLNLAWNGIGDKDTVRPIQRYLKLGAEIKLSYLDLSNNRFTGIAIKMLFVGMRANKTIKTLKMRNNPLTPYEIEDFSRLLILPKSNLQEIDYGDIWVKMSFLPIQKRILNLNKNVHIGGIYSNYKILGPNVQEVLLKRARYVGMKPKKKKLKKDYGEWLLSLKEDTIEKDKFKDYVKKSKIKLDADLIKMIGDKFERKNILSLKNMKEVYLRLYPDTKAPVKKAKKRKGKGKGKGKKGKK